MLPAYTIDLEHGCIFIKWIGDVVAGDFLAFRKKIRQDPAYRLGLNRLVDVRRANYKLSWDEIRTLITRDVEGLDTIEGHRKFAMLVGGDREFGDIRIFNAMADQTDTDIRPFRQLGEAVVWLGLPETLGDPFEQISN